MRPERHIVTSLVIATLFAASMMCAASAAAQTDTIAGPTIMLKARSFGDSVVLRWAPTTPIAWQLLNKYGYRIERYTIVRDSAILNPKPMQILNTAPVKPAPAQVWEPLIDRDDVLAIMAQALYGETFEVTRTNRSSAMQAVNLSREMDSRFSFAIFGADISRAAAQLAGLRWVDKTVKRNERYLYRVMPLVPENIARIPFGFVYLSPREVTTLPVPYVPLMKITGNIVSISIATDVLRDFYTAYQIERSNDNGSSFRAVHRMPLVSVTSGNQAEGFIIHTDTLPTLNSKFFYRIRGISLFGDWGPYSSIFDATGKEVLKVRASVSGIYVTAQNTVMVNWNFPAEEERKVDGFDVMRSRQEAGPYQAVNTGRVAPANRTFNDTAPMPVNYYRLRTIDKSGMELYSNPYLIQLMDSIPPAQPSQIKASINSTGVVNLSWTANTEQDLLGYHVYRSNFKNSEFSRLTVDPITDPAFMDTLDLKTLTGKIYYKINAEDRRFNPSMYSPVTELRKPDVIPPVPPVFKSIKTTSEGVSICWIASSSVDVSGHALWRAAGTSADWVSVTTLSADQPCVTDNPAPGMYRYKVVARDSSGKQSASQVVPARAMGGARAPVGNVRGTADREKKQIMITWSYPLEARKFVVYRSQDQSPPQLYRTIAATPNQFVDQQIIMNTTYKYWIKAVFSDGQESPMGKPVEVKF